MELSRACRKAARQVNRCWVQYQWTSNRFRFWQNGACLVQSLNFALGLGVGGLAATKIPMKLQLALDSVLMQREDYRDMAASNGRSVLIQVKAPLQDLFTVWNDQLDRTKQEVVAVLLATAELLEREQLENEREKQQQDWLRQVITTAERPATTRTKQLTTA